MDSEVREELFRRVGKAVMTNVEIVIEEMDHAGLTTQESCFVAGTALMVLMMKLLKGASLEARKHEVECFCLALREMVLTDGASETRQ